MIRHLLGMYWDGQVYVDAALLFRLRSTPLIFTALADGLQWVLQQQGTSFIAHYLDDFITLGLPGSSQCADNKHITYKTCTELGTPFTAHKCPSPCLGIGIDTIAMELRLLQKKLSKLKELLSDFGNLKRYAQERNLSRFWATSIMLAV